MKIAIQGQRGAYYEIAADGFLKSNKINAKIIHCDVFETVFKKVISGEVEYGVAAIENSLAGSIYKNIDLLIQNDLKVVGEVYVHVQHQLLALKEAKLTDIKEVHSQWPALEQVRHTLKGILPYAKLVEQEDTAISAKFVSEWKDKSKAAVASKKAGKVYGLNVLRKDIQDDNQNYTRFLIVSKKYAKFTNHKPKDYFKTSIVFSGGNLTGFLFKALGCFSLRDINLSKIESRPIPKSPWNYYFYLDFGGKYDDKVVMNALDNLREIAPDVKVLGSYKAGKI